jgi:hypothetical protein
MCDAKVAERAWRLDVDCFKSEESCVSVVRRTCIKDQPRSSSAERESRLTVFGRITESRPWDKFVPLLLCMVSDIEANTVGYSRVRVFRDSPSRELPTRLQPKPRIIIIRTATSGPKAEYYTSLESYESLLFHFTLG